MLLILLLCTNKGIALCKVIDTQTHAPLPYANVMVVGTKTGGITDSNGVAKILLDPGMYSIKVSFIGYTPITKSPVEIFPGKVTEVTFELSPSSIALKGVVVKAPYYTKETLEKPSSIALSSNEIYYSPGSIGDVQRVVQNYPGIFASDNTNDIIVRGGNPDENLIVVDRMEVENLNYFPEMEGMGGGYSVLNSFMIQDFHFYYGTLPVRFGDKISSVFDITIKPGNKERIQVDIEPDFASGGKIHLEGPLFIPSITFNLGAERTGIPFFLKNKEIREFLVKKDILLPEDMSMNSIQGKVSHNKKDYSLSITWIWASNYMKIDSIEKRGENVSAVLGNGMFDAVININRFTNNGSIGVTAYATQNTWDWNFKSLRNDKEVLQNTTSNRKISISLYMLRKQFWGEIEGGIGFKRIFYHYSLMTEPESIFYYTYDSVNIDSVIDSSLVEVVSDRSFDTIPSFMKYGYINYKKDIGKITMEAGIRWDRFDFINEDVFSPRLFLTYHFTPFSNWYIGIGRHYQSPSLLLIAKNPEENKLGYYYADAVVSGITHLLTERTKLSIEGYDKRYYNLPVNKAYTTPEPDDWSNVYINAQSAFSYGVEVFLQRKFYKDGFFNIGFSWMKSQKQDLRTGEFCPGDYDQRLMVGANGGYRVEFKGMAWYDKLNKNTLFNIFKFFFGSLINDETIYSFSFKYASGKPYTPLTYFPEYKRWLLLESTPINSQRLPDYFRCDVRIDTKQVDQKFLGFKFDYYQYIGVTNIFNRNNIYGYVYYDKNGEQKAISQLPLTINAGFTVKIR